MLLLISGVSGFRPQLGSLSRVAAFFRICCGHPCWSCSIFKSDGHTVIEAEIDPENHAEIERNNLQCL